MQHLFQSYIYIKLMKSLPLMFGRWLFCPFQTKHSPSAHPLVLESHPRCNFFCPQPAKHIVSHAIGQQNSKETMHQPIDVQLTYICTCEFSLSSRKTSVAPNQRLAFRLLTRRCPCAKRTLRLMK